MSLTVTGDVVTVADSQISCTNTPSETPGEFVQMVVAPKMIQTPSTSSAPKRMSLQTDTGKLMLLPGRVFNLKKVNDSKVLG